MALNSSIRQSSVRSLLPDHDSYLEDGLYGLGDDNYLSELSGNEMVDLSSVPRGDVNFNKSSMSLCSGFSVLDVSKPYHANQSFSLHSLYNDGTARFGDNLNRLRGTSPKDPSSQLLSEPPLFSDLDSLVSHPRPSLFSDRPSHSRMYSTPSFQAPSLSAPSLFSHSAHPSDCFLPTHSRHNSELYRGKRVGGK